jgi:hypothetical protein
MCSQEYFTSMLCVHKNILLLRYVFKNILLPHCVHKNILLLHYVFTKIFYFYAMCSQKYFSSTLCVQKIFYFHTMCSQKYFTSTLCVNKNILLLRYVFTKLFYFYTMCSQQYFTSTLCGLIKNWMHSFEVSLGVWKHWPKYIVLHVENVVRSMLSYPNETSNDCKHSFPEIHEVNLRTLTERHATTFRKQLVNLLYQSSWTILVKLGEINMTPLIILNKTQSFITALFKFKEVYILLSTHCSCVVRKERRLNHYYKKQKMLNCRK